MGTSFTVGRISEKILKNIRFSYTRDNVRCYTILVVPRIPNLRCIFFMVDILIHKKLEKLIFDKLVDDLSEVVYHPHGQDIWFINFDTKEWYFQYTNTGQLWYNQIFFKNYFNLFSLSNSDYQKILKLWFETSIDLPVNVIMRKNSNMDYYIDGIMRNTNYKWSLKDRFGFSYHTVKHYLGLKSHISEENIKLEHFLTNYEVY
jgi:hypothetical protein